MLRTVHVRLRTSRARYSGVCRSSSASLVTRSFRSKVTDPVERDLLRQNSYLRFAPSTFVLPASVRLASPSLRRQSRPRCLERNPEKCPNLFRGEFEHFIGERGIQPDPECVAHYAVGLGKFTAHAVLAPCHVRLPYQIAAKQEPRADAVLIEVSQQIDARHACGLAQRDWDPEPCRI